MSFRENKKFKILTPSGWEDFAGVAQMGVKDILRLEFEDNNWIECTPDHGLYNSNDKKILAENWKIGDKIQSTHGDLELIKIDKKEKSMTYDIIDVDNGNKFYANNLLSSNCEFISFDETLLSPVYIADHLNKMGEEPMFKMGQVRWYSKIKPNKTYLVGLDPNIGTGNDFSAIQIFQLPEFIQVGEWCHNKSRSKLQIKILRDILVYIRDEMLITGQQIGEPEIYWTVENNTIGETALHIIEETGEETFPGMFLSETKKRGQTKVYRRGYNTTQKSKVEACSRLKNLLEEHKMTLRSKALISELKFFVAKGNSFEAKQGKHDDLVMSTLLVIRMLEYLMHWDDDLREQVAQNLGQFDEDIEPMPTIFL